MKYRIAMWAIVGFLVAGFWGLFFAVVAFPSTNLRDVWPVVCITMPVAIAGLHHAISLNQTLAANAITYALVGLIVETSRKRPHHAR
jgi:uncharacterized BrkB/YihY/UPF0761 family membrane protein